jgi:hypothetical protein
METLIINHKGELIQVAPILQEMDCVFAIDMNTNEGLWIDSKTGEVKEDLEVVGID